MGNQINNQMNMGMGGPMMGGQMMGGQMMGGAMGAQMSGGYGGQNMDMYNNYAMGLYNQRPNINMTGHTFFNQSNPPRMNQ
jgi:hypothetical protein